MTEHPERTTAALAVAATGAALLLVAPTTIRVLAATALVGWAAKVTGVAGRVQARIQPRDDIPEVGP